MGNKQSTATWEELERKLQDSDAIPMVLPLGFLKTITRDFSSDLILGQGGFGVVYKGDLQCGKIIAVKKLNTPHLIEQMFRNEVRFLMGMRKHPNVVRFVGHCDESIPVVIRIDGKLVAADRLEKLMCFEYVPNKSLDKHISAESLGLEWDTRYKIIKGICSGLHFLHEECRIVHLDLKPQNILIDCTMRPKITDFGLSRIFGEEQTRIITKNCPGTRGYMAKEYIDKGVVTKKADIFSLGVIVIEIITGSREYPYFHQGSPPDISTSLQEFKEKVLGSWRNRILSTSESGSSEHYMQQVEQCITTALKCVDLCMDRRPTTKDIIQMLNALDQVPASSSKQLLDVNPLELCFPVESNKLIPFPLYLKNNKDKQVLYRLTEKTQNRLCFLKLPLHGILPPRSTYALIVTADQKENLTEEREVDLILLAGIIDKYIPYIRADLCDEYFEKAKRLENGVHTVALKATYAPRGKTTCEVQQPNPPLTQIISIEKTWEKNMSSLDVNRTEPWILTSHSGGHIDILNYDTKISMGSVETDVVLINAIKFIERKQWFVAASWDGFIYVYNYRTGVKKITSFRAGEAHDFPVTSLSVHPTKPYVLSACCECIKLWDWDKNWECIQTSIELPNYTFHLTFNPKDTNSFASASRDSTVKIWSLDSLKPKYTLSGHRYQVSCLDFFTRDDQQYLITGSYDRTAKIWDMQTKSCIYTLEGFMGCVKSVVSHPSIPVLVTCTEDGDIHLWSATDFRLKRIVRIGGHGASVMTCLVGQTRVVIVHDHLLSILEIHDEEEDAI